MTKIQKLFFLVLTLFTSTTYAVSMETYIDAIKSDPKGGVLPYENGISEMVMAFNAQLTARGRKGLFCLPDDMEMNRNVVRELSLKAYDLHNDKELAKNTPVSYLFIAVLPMAYPCK